MWRLVPRRVSWPPKQVVPEEAGSAEGALPRATGWERAEEGLRRGRSTRRGGRGPRARHRVMPEKAPAKTQAGGWEVSFILPRVNKDLPGFRACQCPQLGSAAKGVFSGRAGSEGADWAGAFSEGKG